MAFENLGLDKVKRIGLFFVVVAAGFAAAVNILRTDTIDPCMGLILLLILSVGSVLMTILWVLLVCIDKRSLKYELAELKTETEKNKTDIKKYYLNVEIYLALIVGFVCSSAFLVLALHNEGEWTNPLVCF